VHYRKNSNAVHVLVRRKQKCLQRMSEAANNGDVMYQWTVKLCDANMFNVHIYYSNRGTSIDPW